MYFHKEDSTLWAELHNTDLDVSMLLSLQNATSSTVVLEALTLKDFLYKDR